MSLKRTAMKMAIAFAAAKGYQAFRARGGLQGVKQMLSQQGGGGGAQGAAGGGLMAGLQGGGGSAGGGLGGLLGALTGGQGTGGASQGGMGGLLGGLAAMAGGSAALGGAGDRDPDDLAQMADKGPQDEATAAAMVRAIGQAVRADGEIDDGERAVLREILGEADTEEDRAALEAALSEPVHPESLARDVPRGHEAEVYAAALTAIDPDHPAERDFLHRFATALALDPQEVSRLHHTAGKPV
ncbi:tellurite resistance TerB family protein [Jannaschia sp. S6380]|uniref:DUF533 domain-containing protein n=1 Tax=Jannaschia sp. S6380 TaxID=2926408 RepID=UPI001FF522D4|nr:DUF533 domain-containing protein [Jannaschia sp. S6380]MCK0166990.1 tellurite resistance TerB family protein [Jannaschia sp. S6380]